LPCLSPSVLALSRSFARAASLDMSQPPDVRGEVLFVFGATVFVRNDESLSCVKVGWTTCSNYITGIDKQGGKLKITFNDPVNVDDGAYIGFLPPVSFINPSHVT
jgi:hypothetical protein